MVGLFLLVPGAISAQAGSPSASAPQLTASATAEVPLRPDRATVSFSVESRGPTAANAGSETARRQQAVLDTLHSLGIAADQMTTASIQINPEFANDTRPPRVAGYVARNIVRVEVRDIDKTGGLIDAALAKGATGIGSLLFSSSKEDEARKQALDMAVSKARGEADIMARAAGGSLGALIELNAQPAFVRSQQVMFGASAMALRGADQTPVAPGQLTVSATVSGRWGFAPR